MRAERSGCPVGARRGQWRGMKMCGRCWARGDLVLLTADRLNPKFPNLRAGVIALSTDSNLLFMDEPEHGQIRRMLTPMFTARKAAEMRVGIQEVVAGALDRVLAAQAGG